MMATSTAFVWVKRLFLLILAGTLIYLLQLGYNGYIFSFDSTFYIKNDHVKVDKGNHRYTNESRISHHSVDTKNDLWQQVSLSELENRFSSKTLPSCQSKCEDTDKSCLATTFDDYQSLISSTTLKLVPLLSEFQYVFPFEKHYLSYPPASDIRKLPDIKRSKFVMADAKRNLVRCDVNDVITGRADLVDGYGEQRTEGGDEIRAWMVNGKQSATGQVTDLRNGSYQVSFRCLWPGEAEILIAVQYPREYKRVAIHQSRIGVTRYLAGQFSRGKVQEITICWSMPNIPGSPCLCNFTSVNQMSFYCGRPLDSRLKCSDWSATLAMTVHKPQNCTDVEVELVKRSLGSARSHSIQHGIRVIVSNTSALPQLQPCFLTSPKVTWNWEIQPKGFWAHEEEWVSLICQRPELTTKWATYCLKNTHVWIFGDSNGFRFTRILKELLKFSLPKSWPYKGTAWRKDGNITVTFTPLEYPLYLGSQWVERLPYGGVAKQIDAIPSEGKHIVIVHYFLHITPSYFSVLYSRLIALHGAIKRLFLRNPEVLVGLRGPHIATSSWNINHAVGGDSLGTEYMRLVTDIFHDLQHKVVFLDGWDMTLAIDNDDRHPTNEIPFDMMRTLLSFKCHESEQ